MGLLQGHKAEGQWRGVGMERDRGTCWFGLFIDSVSKKTGCRRKLEGKESRENDQAL